MKRFMTTLIAGTLAVAMTTVSFAITRGTVVVKDDYYNDEITTALPGQTVYIGLRSVPSSNNDIPNKAYLYEAETINSDTGKDDKLFGNKADKIYSDRGTGGQPLDIVRKEVEDGEYYYFAVLEIEDVKDFPSDGYDVFPGTIRVTAKDGDIFKVIPKLNGIGFEEGDDEFEEDVLGFVFERDDDVEISLPGGGGYLSGIARKDCTIVASMNTDEVSSIVRKYPDADLRFYRGNDASLSNLRSPKLYFYASEDEYLYEITGTSTLTNRTSTYDEDEGAFIVSTNTLGKYLISDTRLSSTGSSTSTSREDEDEDKDEDIVYPNYDYPSYVVPINPTTGATA